MFKSKLFGHLSAIALLVCVVAGCTLFRSLTKPTVLTSPDGKFQLTVPVGWSTNAALHETATIKAANTVMEMYVIVLTESKDDFSKDITLDKFTDITRNNMMTKVGSPEATSPVPVSINGRGGLQYEIQGTVKNINVAYIVTAVETANHFHQVITWTLRSRKDQNRSTLLQVTESFREASAQSAGGSPSP